MGLAALSIWNILKPIFKDAFSAIFTLKLRRIGGKSKSLSAGYVVYKFKNANIDEKRGALTT